MLRSGYSQVTRPGLASFEDTNSEHLAVAMRSCTACVSYFNRHCFVTHMSVEDPVETAAECPYFKARGKKGGSAPYFRSQRRDVPG